MEIKIQKEHACQPFNPKDKKIQKNAKKNPELIEAPRNCSSKHEIQNEMKNKKNGFAFFDAQTSKTNPRCVISTMRERPNRYGSGHGKPRGHKGARLRRKKTVKKRSAKSPSRAIKKNAKVSKSVKETSPARSENAVSNGDRFEDFALGGDLYLRVSGAPSAGLRVYTRKILRKGQIIAKVESEKVDVSRLNELRTTKSDKMKYVVLWNKQNVFLGVDVPKEGKGLGSFVDCGGKNKSGDDDREFCLRNGELVVRTTKDIDSYHELFVAYGSGYDFR